MDINEIIQFIGAYEEDKPFLNLVKAAVVQELEGLINNFDENNLTPRQKLLMLGFIQDFYENRDLYEERKTYIRNGLNNMLLNEIYKG